MTTQRFFHRFISLFFGVILTLGGLPPATALGSSTPASPPSQDRGPVAPANSGLYRTTVAVSGPSRWQRLEALGVVILERQEDTGVVLADDEQLEALARLRFEPQASDELAALLAGQGPERAWLQASLQPLVTQGAALQALLDDKAAVGEAVQSARQSLRSAMHSITPEQRAGMASSSSLDDDADGLTNTQEAWWCTDPLNPDSDGDGRTDGEEIQALWDWMANRRAAPPGETPWPSWPFNATTCPDKDHDSLPNLVERWELGLNMDWESTDHDKFDDGQELFGVTYCPGGDFSCGYGDLPRSQDSGYVGAIMPAWVRAPEKHPLVAAFPLPTVKVLESSIHVETATTVTTDHVITSGTEKTYSTSKLEGTNTGNTNTTTWNGWEEISDATTRPVEGLSRAQLSSTLINYQSTSVMVQQPTASSSGITLGGAVAAVEAPMKVVEAGTKIGNAINEALWLGTLYGWNPTKWHGHLDEFDESQMRRQLAKCQSGKTCRDPATGVLLLDGGPYAVTQQGADVSSQNSVAGNSSANTTLRDDGAYTYPFQPIEVKVQMPPTQTHTESKGQSWGGAESTTSERYEEHTVTNGEAFSSAESWGNATAQDTIHAADLWFTYSVQNVGSEYAREIADLAFNVYLGESPNPIYTYFVGPDLGGDGKFHNFMPDEQHTYTSRRIPLTLEQLKAIDLGGQIRVTVEEFNFGIDELYYQDALNAGVLIAIEDGTSDYDETIENYLIPTWGVETVLDLLARYFPHSTDSNGMLTAIWTPESRTDTPHWCQEPQAVGTGAQRTLWCKHALSTADWWNFYTNGLGDGSEGFQDTPATPGATALFRFNADTDLDGYSDRSEQSLGTDPGDALSYPRPEILAGLHSGCDGSHVTATLSLLNTGLYDAYGVQATMIAPNDSITITNNTVGGSGRVRAQQSVVVGSRINLENPLPTAWLEDGHAKPAHGGYFAGNHDRLYTFTVQACGNPAGCQVGSGTWRLAWNDGAGAGGMLNFGQGYASPVMLEVGTHGIKLALLSGKVLDGEQFTIDARTPRDTFQFEVLQEPYTPPLVLVSYNDPQGNHRFVIPPEAMQLISPTADLMAFSGQMLPDVGVEIVTSGAAAPGANTTTLQVINPTETTLTDAHLFLDFVNISGTVTSEVAITTTLPPGPSVVPATWDTAQFDPPYDPEQDYIVMAFWTDYQGNIIDTAARPLSSFQEDPRAVGHLSETAWDFGVAAPGQVLHGHVSLANTSFFDLHVQASAQGDGLSVEAAGLGKVPATGFAEYQITLDTTGLPPGPYSGVVSIRTNDVSEPVKQVQVTGMIVASDVWSSLPDVHQPWDEFLFLPGPLAANDIVSYTSSVTLDDATEPLLFRGSNGVAKGRGKGVPPPPIAIRALPVGNPPDIALDPQTWITATQDWQTQDLLDFQIRFPVDWRAFESVAGESVEISQETGVATIHWEIIRRQQHDSPDMEPMLARFASEDKTHRDVTVKGIPAWEITPQVPGEGMCKAIVLAWIDAWLVFEHRAAQPSECASGDLFDLILSSLQYRVGYAQGTDADLPVEPAQAAAAAGLQNLGSTAPEDVDMVNYNRQAAYNYAAEYWDDLTNNDGYYVWCSGSIKCDAAHYVAHVIQNGGFPIHWNVGQNNSSSSVISVGAQRSYVLGTGHAVETSAGNLRVGDIVYMYRGTWCFEGAVVAMNSGVPYLSTHSNERWNVRYDLFACNGTGSMVFNFVHIDATDDYPPDTPALYDIGNGDGDGNYTVSWSGAYRATSYELIEQYSGGGWTSIYSGGATAVNLGGRAPGLWCYQVRGWNGAGASGWGGPKCTWVRSTAAATLNAISNGDGDGNYSVSWSGVTGATGYELQERLNSGTWTTIYNSSGTSLNVTGRTAGDWCYQVRPTNPAGSGPWSNQQCTRVNTPPNPPSGLTPPSGTDWFGRRVTMTWQDGGDPDNFPNPTRVFRANITNTGGAWSTTTTWGQSTTATTLVPDDGPYAWKAQSNDGAADSAWTATNSLSVYSIGKTASDEVEIALPETVASSTRYVVQYGARATLADAGSTQVVSIQVPKRLYAAFYLDAIVAQSGTSAPTLWVDIGNDGTAAWSEQVPSPLPQTVGSPNLAAGLNTYLNTVPAPGGTLVDVPIGVSLGASGLVFLTNPALTPGADADPSIGPADISFSNNTPTETDPVTISATVHNGGIYQARNVMASFYAGDPASGGYLIGSDFLPAIATGGSEIASVVWDTTGYTGPMQVQVTLDPTDQLAELDENNNTAQSSITVLTRPDLSAPAISPSNPEPVVNEPVTVDLTLANGGQTDAGAFLAALYDGNPASGGMLICQQTATVAGGGQTVVSCPWVPASTGLHRLFAVVDPEGVIGEFDEGNNETWHDVYVGFAGPLLLDSGNAAADPPYTAEAGYGVIDQGLPDVLVSCGPGTAPEDTLRLDPDGRVVYRFDHLLPGHFYHLDIILRECDGVGRLESILVDGNLIEGSISLAGGQPIYRSLLLDPALYADRSITVTIEEPAANGAVVSQVNLYDIDYRYADAGGARDPQYPGVKGYGWLDGVPGTVWGTLPYQSARVDQGDSQQRYRFDGLDPDRQYQVNMTFYQSSGTGRQQVVEIDGLPSGLSVNTGDYIVHRLTATVPLAAYVGDGSIVVTTRRTNASTGAMVNEISLEELTHLTGPRPAIANLRVSNISDTSFTVSWTTNVATTGYVHYGASDALGQLAYDERGSTTIDDTHHVKLENLTPGVTYQFDVLAGQAVDDNNGAHYSVTTGATLPPPGSDTIYGRVFKPDGATLAGGALVYARVCDANGQGSPGCSAWLSSLVAPANGFWYTNLGQVRTESLSSYFSYSPAGDRLELTVEGAADCRAALAVDTANDSPVADIVLRCTIQAPLTSNPGWNLLALPLQPLNPHTASSLLDLINSQGGQCSEIDRWRFGGWDAHIYSLPFNDFDVELGKGYFTRCSAGVTWTLEGNALGSSVPIALQAGWNLVSVPHPPSHYTAHTLLGAIAAQGGACSEIDRWLNGGWDAHIYGLPFNNFAVEPHQGYFVKCSQPSTFTPSATLAAAERAAWPEPIAPVALEPVDDVAITDVLVTNRRDVALAITWRTDRPSTGWVEYGDTPELGQVAYDDRGEKTVSAVHHVTLTGLQPEAAVYYRVHAGAALADDGGQPFVAATAARLAPSAPATAFGQITTSEGAPAVGSLALGWLVDKAGSRSEPLSALVDGWGYWVLSLPEIDCQQFELHLEIFDPSGVRTEYDRPACQ